MGYVYRGDWCPQCRLARLERRIVGAWVRVLRCGHCGYAVYEHQPRPPKQESQR